VQIVSYARDCAIATARHKSSYHLNNYTQRRYRDSGEVSYRDCGEVSYRDCGWNLVTAAAVTQQPGTCKAATSWNTRRDSLKTNVENALLRSSFRMLCIQDINSFAHSDPCSVTIFLSQASLNHLKSFL